jgi:PAS domain S-box-containing protein
MEFSGTNKSSSFPEFLSGGGEMGQRIRDYDWSSTSLGPVETWPQSLRTCIRIMLISRQPIWIGWGKELIKFYNDPYKAIVGGKHPWALGQPASVVWKDIWKDIEPMLKVVMEQNEGTYVESQLLIMERNGYPEETYYTFSYTPIPGDDGKTEGMFCANSDDTDKIISERQLKTLTALGKELSDCKTREEIITRTLSTLSENPQDFPFAIFRDLVGNKAILEQTTPMRDALKILPTEIDLLSDNPVAQVIKRSIDEKSVQLYENLISTVGELPKGAWEIPTDKTIVLPIIQSGGMESYGVLVIGMNPYRLFDENYKSFFSLIADQVANAFADVFAFEEERKRVEALAEIDRAKTHFFSNISHEFRTPLTLILGPVQEVLQDENIDPEVRMKMQIANRNALRMQRLVNTLLDFSRIEAGRLEGKFIKTDIISLTKDLAGNFRSAIERAGMQLEFETSAITSDVYVDHEMWEKIILNLLSNALKYSDKGKIVVTINQRDKDLIVIIKDSGIGIPEDQLEKIFDRFHRVESTGGRSQEGTGIGLSMVRELIKIHKGTIRVESQVGEGSSFIINIPLGKDHLDGSMVAEGNYSRENSLSESFSEEANQWLIENEQINLNNSSALSVQNDLPLILLAEDNTDMRGYVKRVLSSRCIVHTANNGAEAIEMIRQHNYELDISDVMMPVMNGFELLKKIREDYNKKNTPVIFLSARAGEEAKVEGIDAGADDYLVKPFSSRELVAKVEANIKIARNRIKAEKNLRNIIYQSPFAMNIMKGNDFVIEIANRKVLEMLDKKEEEIIGKSMLEVFPELAGQGIVEILNKVIETGEPFTANELPIVFQKSEGQELLYVNLIFEPIFNDAGEVDAIISVSVDVTAQVKARNIIEQSQKELNELANAVPQLVWVADKFGIPYYYNERVSEFNGIKKNEQGVWEWEVFVHPDDLEITRKEWGHAVANGTLYQVEHRLGGLDGSYRWYLSRALPFKNDKGEILKWFGSSTDIQASKEQSAILEEEVIRRTAQLNELNTVLHQSNYELQQFAHVASHDLREPLRKIKTFTERLSLDPGNTFTEKSKVFIDKINSASDRLFTMVEGVLNYSVLNASKQSIEFVDLNIVVDNIKSDLELLIQKKNAVISHSLLPVVEGSSVLLYQLFYNLINNAIKFSRPDEDPVILITTSPGTTNGKPCFNISISDNGIGFEPEYADKIFESFIRLNSKDKFEGTGLGLSLCKRIVERHSGQISAESVPGQGSTFHFCLPVKQNSNRL